MSANVENVQSIDIAKAAKNVKMAHDVEFDGGAADLFVTGILAWLVTVCSFGICYPWALCMIEKWKASHTIVDGNRLDFTGSAVGLFGNWLKWWFLCAVTFGIYSFWVYPDLQKWKAKNTVIKR